MSELMKRDKVYAVWVRELKERHCLARVRASMAVNSGQLAFNWSVGRDIVVLKWENAYDSKFYASLSHDLNDAIAGSKGFSPTNLKFE